VSAIHIYSQYNPSDLDAARRYKVAAQSWARQQWIDCPIEQFPRWWREEGVALPYIIDLFDAGCAARAPTDIIIFTNLDCITKSDAALQIIAHLQRASACYAYRFDFNHKLMKPPADSEFTKGQLYPGSDLVAFRASWWMAHRHKMPDMVLGLEAADPVLRRLVDETNIGTSNEVLGIIAHERHYSRWEDSKNRYRLKGQLHNLTLAKKFFRQRKINEANFGIRGV